MLRSIVYRMDVTVLLTDHRDWRGAGFFRKRGPRFLFGAAILCCEKKSDSNVVAGCDRATSHDGSCFTAGFFAGDGGRRCGWRTAIE